MRGRKVVEGSVQTTLSNGPYTQDCYSAENLNLGTIMGNQAVIIEVLLDLRDILIRNEEKP